MFSNPLGYFQIPSITFILLINRIERGIDEANYRKGSVIKSIKRNEIYKKLFLQGSIIQLLHSSSYIHIWP